MSEKRSSAKPRVKSSDNNLLRDQAVRARAYIRITPKNAAEQNRLGEEMVHWVFNTHTYALEEFPISLHMAPSYFYRMAETNDYFAHCLNLARMVIAARLQNEWRTKNIEREYALRLLPLYHEEFKEFTLAKIMRDSQGKELARLTVVIPNLEATAEAVTEKKDE